METKDFGLATTLVSLGCEYQVRRDGKVMYFIFQDTPEINELIGNYWDRKLMIEPLAYGEAARLLKMRIYNQ